LKLISSNVGANAIYFQINSAVQMYIIGVKLKEKRMKRATTGSTGHFQLQNREWCRAEWHISARAFALRCGV